MRHNRAWLIGAVLLVALAGGVGVWQLVRHRSHLAHQEAGSYYCPMHPTYQSDRPGDCPICNMRLVKREMAATLRDGSERLAEPSLEPSGHVPVQLTPQKQQLIGVTTAPVGRRAITKTIRTVGRVAYDPELYQAQQEYLQAVRASQTPGSSEDPAQQLVEAARLRLRLLGLSEPFIETMASWTGPDRRLLLTDPDGSVWIYAPVYEFELPYVTVDQPITVELPARPGKTLGGTVASIDPVFDPMTRSVRVRALVTDPDQMLRPEMYVNVSLAVDEGEVVALPVEAVLETGTRRLVFVEQGEGRFEPREVAVGLQADGYYEVTAGVVEGERVVTSGNFLIDAESRLKAALQGMGDEGHRGHEGH